MKQNITIFIAVLIFLLSNSAKTQVVINEYSASNLATVVDNYGSNEDWIELFNTSSQQADISGYYLSDRINNPTKWQFPDGVVIPANGFLRIWASGRDEISGNHYHTNFRLTQTGDNPEYVVCRISRRVSDRFVQLEITQKDHSRGRQPNGSENWKIFTVPTPGTSNNNQQAIWPMLKNRMSETAGFYENPLSIIITTAEPNSTIYYTTNGNEPTTSSTHIYSAGCNK
jgi:hypothetical protein